MVDAGMATAKDVERWDRALTDDLDNVVNTFIAAHLIIGEDTGSSDVDILVDLADGVGVVGLVGLERELSEILKRPVDVVPAAGLKPPVAKRVANEAIAL